MRLRLVDTSANFAQGLSRPKVRAFRYQISLLKNASLSGLFSYLLSFGFKVVIVLK